MPEPNRKGTVMAPHSRSQRSGLGCNGLWRQFYDVWCRLIARHLKVTLAFVGTGSNHRTLPQQRCLPAHVVDGARSYIKALRGQFNPPIHRHIAAGNLDRAGYQTHPE